MLERKSNANTHHCSLFLPSGEILKQWESLVVCCLRHSLSTHSGATLEAGPCGLSEKKAHLNQNVGIYNHEKPKKILFLNLRENCVKL